jgi:hypothetical protein
MLGLNCGFGTKEIATLTIGEVFLHQALPADEQEVFGFGQQTPTRSSRWSATRR